MSPKVTKPKKSPSSKAKVSGCSKPKSVPVQTTPFEDLGDMTVLVDVRASKDRRDGDRRKKEVQVAKERRDSGERRAKVNRRRQIDPTTCEREYSDDELEFMSALDDYKRRNGRMFPTCSEVLEVLKGIGYAKSTAPACGTSEVGDAPEFVGTPIVAFDASTCQACEAAF